MRHTHLLPPTTRYVHRHASLLPLVAAATSAKPEGVLATPDGKLVYVTSEVTNSVHIVDVATRKQVGMVKVGKRPRRFALTPDGSELWVSNELSASVSIIDTAK